MQAVGGPGLEAQHELRHRCDHDGLQADEEQHEAETDGEPEPAVFGAEAVEAEEFPQSCLPRVGSSLTFFTVRAFSQRV